MCAYVHSPLKYRPERLNPEKNSFQPTTMHAKEIALSLGNTGNNNNKSISSGEEAEISSPASERGNKIQSHEAAADYINNNFNINFSYFLHVYML